MALFRRSAKADDDETVSLDDDAYAWWAHRDQLSRAFVPKERTEAGPGSVRPDPAEQQRSSAFAEQYSTESLFNWASGSEPDAPTHGGRGTPLDPYRMLGLQPGASLEEVVGAHRRLAKEYHPDRHHGVDEAGRAHAAEQMSLINAAYHELRSRLSGHRHGV